MSSADKSVRPVRVIGISGSLRQGNSTSAIVSIALDGARAVGAEVDLLNLDDYDLPFCDGRDDESTYPPGVHRLRSAVAAADGIILGTPEYHGAIAGVLKNALDLMGSDEFRGKMLGLVGVSGGRMGATNALGNLRIIGRSLHAWVVPEQVSVSRSDDSLNPDRSLKDPRLQASVRHVGAQVARFAFLHSSDRPREFPRLWEEAQGDPGGR